jgi:hypothetical protein
MHSGSLAADLLQPRPLHCRRLAAKHNGFLVWVAMGRPNRSPTKFGEEKGAVMKFATVSKTLVIGVALLLGVSAFAATKGSLQLNNPVTVNGTTLKPGDYKVQWDGSGPNVELSFIQGNKVLAKVPAHIVELQTPAANTAAVTQSTGSGPSALAGVRFQGKKFALDLNESADAAMQAGGSSR